MFVDGGDHGVAGRRVLYFKGLRLLIVSMSWKLDAVNYCGQSALTCGRKTSVIVSWIQSSISFIFKAQPLVRASASYLITHPET